MKSPLGRFESPPPPHFQHLLAEVVKNIKPRIMIETGLETGYGAEFYLQAMDAVGAGHLYSIEPVLHKDYAPNPIVHPRFTLVKGKSQDVLVPLLKEIGPVEIFLHDSDHSYECQTFEYEVAWEYVVPGGVIASDDPFWGMPPHLAWDRFLERHNVKARHIIGNAQWIHRQ